MQLSQVKQHLSTLDTLRFDLPDGTQVPAHFHVTEVGLHTRHFIDCGGTVRQEQRVNFQLWYSVDDEHRLAPQKLRNIIALSERKLGLADLPVEVEYQGPTIGRYTLQASPEGFTLMPTYTDCLAKDNCGIPQEPVAAQSGCAPGSGCC